MTPELRAVLDEIQSKLAQQSQRIRKERVKKIKGDDEAISLRGLQLAADVKTIFQILNDTVTSDIRAYYPPLPPEAQQPTVQTVTPPPTPLLPTAGYAVWLAAELAPHLPPRPQSNVPHDPLRIFQRIFDAEMKDLSQEGPLLGALGAAFVPKLQKAHKAFEEGRHSDVITILKTALRGAPSNNVMLFILSQYLYYLTATGQRDALPEARDFAQKAMMANDKMPEDKLLQYRYLSLAAERSHDENHVIAWIREHNLLSSKPFYGREGLAANKTLSLRTWVLAAGLSHALWHEAEITALKELVMSVVGGGAFYLFFCRTRLLEMPHINDNPIPALDAIESTLTVAYQHHHRLRDNLTAFAAIPATIPWTVRQRYLRTFLAVASPPPTFDQTLMNISLDGQYWNHGALPDTGFRAALADGNDMSYWRLWAHSLAQASEISSYALIPATEAMSEAETIPLCDKALTLLAHNEAKLMRPGVWEEIKPWLNKWQLAHFLAAATGSNHPRDAFAPRTAPLASLYRRWNKTMPSAILASEVLQHTAQQGGFANTAEIQMALEGAAHLIDDPTHGMVATQKRALKAAKQQNPGSKFDALSMGDVDLGAGFQQILTILLPIGLLGGFGAIIMNSQNIGQTIGLSLALLGVTGMVLLTFSKKS